MFRLHKAYCGKGGYPAVFDNIGSPYKLIIDMASMADSTDVATDCISLNYQKIKTVDMTVDGC